MLSSLLVILLLSFQNSHTVKPQFFVEGYKTDFNDDFLYYVTINNVTHQFNKRYVLLKFMNDNGYKCVTHSFNTSHLYGHEFFIFE